jgi:16S rRNA (guanine(966)-N(2))-methyltransferase RsmD
LRVRPTSGKTKEALFSILGERVKGARLLDLFAGTGSIGIEALSRGADRAEFVEYHPASLTALETNLRRCGYIEKARVHKVDVLRYLKHPGGLFDIVYVDPPYHTGILKKLLPRLSRDGIITPTGTMIIEHFHKMALPDRMGSLQRTRTERYGDTVITFYCHPAGSRP